jgi:hypothetical protein
MQHVQADAGTGGCKRQNGNGELLEKSIVCDKGVRAATLFNQAQHEAL